MINPDMYHNMHDIMKLVIYTPWRTGSATNNVFLKLKKINLFKNNMFKFKFKFKLSFIVIPLHVGTYSGTKCRASQDHGAT